MPKHVHAYAIPDLAPSYRCVCGRRARRIVSGINRDRWHQLEDESPRWPEKQESADDDHSSATTPTVDAVFKGYRRPI